MSTANKIAVIGMNGRFPSANSVDELWENLLKENDSFTLYNDKYYTERCFPEEIFRSQSFVKRCPRLIDATGFHLDDLNCSAEQALTMPQQTRLLLGCAVELCDRTGYTQNNFNGSIGFWGGQGFDNYALKCLQSLHKTIHGFPNLLKHDANLLAPTLARYLNLKGPVIQVQTACSTSLVAVHQAALALKTYQCDIALAGGVSIQYAFLPGYLYQEGEIFSPDGYCRPFDAAANGTVFGEGCGVVMLKRLQDALADNDNILGVITGSSISNDGAARAGFTAPGVTGQLKVLNEAYHRAGISPEQLNYLEAHGTGTPVGDPLELSALNQFFQKHTKKQHFVELGALKATIGHLDAAAGVAGLIKCLLIIKNGQIPKLHNYTKPNEHIDFKNSAFRISQKTSQLADEKPFVAGISSFGLGGTNAHVVVQNLASI